MPHTLCVYAASSDALDGVYFDDAAALGRLIGQGGHTLIYGGGRVGLMGTVARAAQASGGRVIGVIPEALLAQGYEGVDQQIVTRDLRERKAIMEARADAFIGLPGGFGTLEEVLEILTLKQLGFHSKPVVVLNTAGFYDALMAVFEQLYARRFAWPEYRALYHLAADPEAAMAYLEAYRPTPLPQKWTGEGR